MLQEKFLQTYVQILNIKLIYQTISLCQKGK